MRMIDDLRLNHSAAILSQLRDNTHDIQFHGGEIVSRPIDQTHENINRYVRAGSSDTSTKPNEKRIVLGLGLPQARVPAMDDDGCGTSIGIGREAVSVHQFNQIQESFGINNTEVRPSSEIVMIDTMFFRILRSEFNVESVNGTGNTRSLTSLTRRCRISR